MAEVLKKFKVVTTRKPHFCGFCEREFPKGTDMGSHTYVDSDGIHSVYTCETCQEIIEKYYFDADEISIKKICEQEGVKTPEELLERMDEMGKIEKDLFQLFGVKK
jgi:hypothetical protein